MVPSFGSTVCGRLGACCAEQLAVVVLPCVQYSAACRLDLVE
jgi:hypothetical protein